MTMNAIRGITWELTMDISNKVAAMGRGPSTKIVDSKEL